MGSRLGDELFCETCDREVNEDELIGVEYAIGGKAHYDGVSEWQHIVCGRREGRWSGRQLGGHFLEPRYGEGPLVMGLF